MRSRIAATAALLVALAVVATFWHGGEPPTADRQASTDSQSNADVRRDLTMLNDLIETLGAQVQASEAVDVELLQALTRTTAGLAEQIKTRPDAIAREDVIGYIQAVADGRAVLSAVRVESGAESELSEARRATQDGIEAASRYFVASR